MNGDQLTRELRKEYDIKVVAEAILSAENHFRPLIFRVFEVFFVVLCCLLRKDVESVTIGMCQAQIRFWRERYGGNLITIIVRSFFRSNAREVAVYVLRRYAESERLEIGLALKSYCGEISRAYFIYVLFHIKRSYITEFNGNRGGVLA